LDLLKAFAKGVVASLCVSEGVCAGDDGGEDGVEGEVGLMCTRVESWELPWVSGGELQAEEEGDWGAEGVKEQG
jgi:hypothetical protein